jgi:hypothetical protein
MPAYDVDVAKCVGCGCTDLRACAGGCSWLAVNRAAGTGVCSNCPKSLTAWRHQRAEVGQLDSKTASLVEVDPG